MRSYRPPVEYLRFPLLRTTGQALRLFCFRPVQHSFVQLQAIRLWPSRFLSRLGKAIPDQKRQWARLAEIHQQGRPIPPMKPACRRGASRAPIGQRRYVRNGGGLYLNPDGRAALYHALLVGPSAFSPIRAAAAGLVPLTATSSPKRRGKPPIPFRTFSPAQAPISNSRSRLAKSHAPSPGAHDDTAPTWCTGSPGLSLNMRYNRSATI